MRPRQGCAGGASSRFHARGQRLRQRGQQRALPRAQIGADFRGFDSAPAGASHAARAVSTSQASRPLPAPISSDLPARHCRKHCGAMARRTEVLRPAINANPEQALLWNTLGTVMCSLGDGKTALTFFDETLRLAPNFGKAYHNRAYAKLDLGDVEGALADCDLAIAAGRVGRGPGDDAVRPRHHPAGPGPGRGRLEDLRGPLRPGTARGPALHDRGAALAPRHGPGRQIADDLRRTGPG